MTNLPDEPTSGGPALDDELSRLADPPRVRSYLWFLAGIGLLAVLEGYGYLFGFPRSPVVFTFVALTVGAIAVAYTRRRLPPRTDIQLARERVVHNTLESLRDAGFAVFHGVSGGEVTLDHVVVSDRGVLLVEARIWPKPTPGARITLGRDGIRLGDRRPARDPLLELRARTRWLSNLLEQLTGATYPVRGVLMVPGWTVEYTVPRDTSDVWVLEPRDLAESIVHEPRRLASLEVGRAVAQLERYTNSAHTT